MVSREERGIGVVVFEKILIHCLHLHFNHWDTHLVLATPLVDVAACSTTSSVARDCLVYCTVY